MRFNYAGNWTINTLDEICDFYKGNGLSKSDLSSEGRPCILYGELYTSYKKEIIDSIISKTDTMLSKPFISKKNDVIIPGSGEDPIDIAVARAIENDGIILGGDLNILRLHPKYSGAFLSYQLNGKRRYEIAKKAQGKSIVHLHNSDLKDIKVFMPQYDEQLKIINLLKHIDKRIELQNKIIEEYSTLKNRINDLFFNDKDKFYKFSDLYEFAKEGGTPSTKNTEFYENGTIPFIKIEDLDRKYIKTNGSFINEKGLSHSSAWIIPTNSIILSNGATIGSVSINMYPVSTKQGILGIIPSKLVSTEYMYYLLTRSDFRRKLKSITTRGTMETAYLKDIDTIELPIPNRCMQEKQCKVLSSIDNRIDVEKEILNNLIVQKQYLLNNIFI